MEELAVSCNAEIELNLCTPKLRILQLAPFSRVTKINQVRPFTCKLEEFETTSNFRSSSLTFAGHKLDLSCLSFLNPIRLCKEQIRGKDIEYVNQCTSIEKITCNSGALQNNLNIKRLKSISLRGNFSDDAKWYFMSVIALINVVFTVVQKSFWN